jgi:hypothetical protein
MNTKRVGLALALVVCLLGCFVGVQRVAAGQGVIVPSGDRLRFQLVGDEPIAGPDGRSVVTGWSVLMFRDRQSGLCYLAFKQVTGIAALQAATCPQ